MREKEMTNTFVVNLDEAKLRADLSDKLALVNYWRTEQGDVPFNFYSLPQSTEIVIFGIHIRNFGLRIKYTDGRTLITSHHKNKNSFSDERYNSVVSNGASLYEQSRDRST